jgi:hypothetical protein
MSWKMGMRAMIEGLSRDIIDQSETQTESYNYLSEVSIADLEQRISRLERVQRKLKKMLGLN